MGLFFDRTDPTSPPPGRPNLWTAPHSGPNSPAGAPGSAPGVHGPPASPSVSGATLGALQSHSGGPVHPSGLHPDTMRHVANHLHGMAQAMEGKPHVMPQSPAGMLLHQPTLHAISHATRNMGGGGPGPQPIGPTINRVA